MGLKSDRERTGFMAQDIEPLFPRLVGQGKYLGLNDVGLIPHLIEAIKELKEEIETLKQS